MREQFAAANPLGCFAIGQGRMGEIDSRRRTLQEAVRRARRALLCWICAVAATAAAQVHANAADPIPPAFAARDEARAFAGREHVTLDEVVATLDILAEDIAESPAVRKDYEDLVYAFDLADTPELYRDYVRVKLAFEATRDGGWWHLSWKITNEKPNSEQIWSQWASQGDMPRHESPAPTAFAECDELSAMFAFFGRRLGVHGLGLYWPTWNHVVAVWTVQSEDGEPVRIVVPTSQIFLDEDATLGTDGFDPWTQKTIYEYRRRDVRGEHRIDADLARFLVEQVARHGAKSQAALQQERNERDAALVDATYES